MNIKKIDKRDEGTTKTLYIFPNIPCEFYASQWLTHTLPFWCYHLLYATTNVLNHLSYFLLLSSLFLRKSLFSKSFGTFVKDQQAND